MRKRIFCLAILALLVIPLAFSSGTSDTQGEQTTTAAAVSGGKYSEAPMLAERVANGELPPVDERLPKNPVVITTGMLAEPEYLQLEIGKYGGEFRTHMTQYQPFIEWLLIAPNFSYDIKSGNLVEEWEISDDFKQYTFTLREGLRWSDGVLVTTEDVRFAWEVLNDARIYPSLHATFKQGGLASGAAPEMTVLDEYTWQYTFPETDYLFLTRNLSKMGRGHNLLFLKPAHYLKQFHIDYTDASEIDPILAEKQLDDWSELFRLKDPRFFDNMPNDHAELIGVPLLSAWLPIEVNEDFAIAERNPYYFKVDAAGQQLPYIDRLWMDRPYGDFGERHQIMMWTQELDYFWGAAQAMPIMLENQENGDFTMYPYSSPAGMYLNLNLTYEDPQWRELVWQKEFRWAIDHAINKPELIDEVYNGTGTLPMDHTPTETTREYSPSKANALLDEIGMTRRDSDGYRLGLDGNPFDIAFDSWTNPEYIKDLELIIPQLKEVGLRASLKVFDNTAMGPRLTNNQTQAHFQWGSGNMWPLYIGAADYVPAATWAPLWLNWQLGREPAEEPPEWIKPLYEIWDRVIANPAGSAETLKAFDDLYALHQELAVRMPVVYGHGNPHYISNKIGNVTTWAYHHGQWDTWTVRYFK